MKAEEKQEGLLCIIVVSNQQTGGHLMRLEESLSRIWGGIQRQLFEYLEEEMGELNRNHRKLVAILEIVRIEDHVPRNYIRARGRPLKERTAIGRAFIAKTVYNMNTTRDLLDRLSADKTVRRLCGWVERYEVPSEATFSRAFDEFARNGLLQKVHEAMIGKHMEKEILGHISRDATEIEAREKPKKREKPEIAVEVRREESNPGRKSGKKARKQKRLERQNEMSLEQMLEDLPKVCDVGVKTNSKGNKEKWIGYKLHIDVADGQIPISCILTSASLHDSQAALPLAEMTRHRVVNLYDLMDSAYDSNIIREHSESMGHKPIIDTYNRGFSKVKDEREAEYKRLKLIHFELPEQARYKNRTTVERVNSRLKDEFGGRTVRVRGHAKVLAHLMFGILALTADQLLRLVT
jgi:hypothetical protein